MAHDAYYTPASIMPTWGKKSLNSVIKGVLLTLITSGRIADH